MSAPFHCTLMKPAAEIMKNKINSIQFKDPNFEIINNVTAKAEISSDKIKKLLIKQNTSMINEDNKSKKTSNLLFRLYSYIIWSETL